MERALEVQGFVDVDWAWTPFDRRSTSGYSIKVGGNLVVWKSKKQSVVTRSSVEAEYRAIAKATTELGWMENTT